MINKAILAAASVALSGSIGLAATAPLYSNYGNVTDAPQIDAAAFFNGGIFNIFTTLPFSTLNTLNYTNRGTMIGAPGWVFDYATMGGNRLASSVVNNGNLEGQDVSQLAIIIGDTGLNQIIPNGGPVSRIQLGATNISSSGLMTVGEGGLLELKGKIIKLNRSGVRSGPSPSGSRSGSSDFVIRQGTNYINAPEIQDVYWGVGTNQALVEDRGRLIDLLQFPFNFDVPNPQSPLHEVQNSLLNTNFFINVVTPTSTNFPYSAFVFTNTVNSTSIVIQVAFVATNLFGGEVRSEVRWAPGRRGARVPIVRIGSRAYDSVLDAFFTNYVYVSDDMLTRSNLFLSLNLDEPTARPVNYRVGTAAPVDWFSADVSNKIFNYFEDIYSQLWDYRIITNGYTGYSFLVNRERTTDLNDFFVGLPDRGFNFGNPFTPNFNDPTNRQGRVEINATESLDISRTRIRGNRYAEIKSPNTSFDLETIIDSPFISLKIGSPTNLTLQGTIPFTVDRISGEVNCYSANWTNRSVTFDFSDPNNVQSNVTIINQHVFIVDNATVESTVDVSVTDLHLKSTNITVANSMFVTDSMRLEGHNVTLAATIFGLNFRGDLTDLGPTNFPSMTNFANQGLIYNYGVASLGTAPGDPLARFRNAGYWQSYGFDIHSDSIVNDGTLYSPIGVIGLTATNGNLETGSLIASGDIYLRFKELDSGFSALTAGGISTFNGLQLLFPGKIFIDVADEIRDGGEFQLAPINFWESTDGFSMLEKPLFGDFHGTRFYSFAFQFSEVVHQWAGEDLGLSDEGFVNNAAMGELLLDGDFLSLFTFDTVDGNNALYVEYLNLRNYATNASESLNIKPGMKIYFTRASVPLARLANIPGLIYLPVSTAPAATTVALANGFSYTAKNNLLFSEVLDSDADGVVNALDATPFDEVNIAVEYLSEPAPFAHISWNAAPLTEYILQYKDDISDSGWKELKRITTYSEFRSIAVNDTGAQPGHRYYRVIYNP